MIFNRIFDLLNYQQERYSNGQSLCIHGPSVLRKYSTAQLIARTNQLSCYFLKKGYKKGDNLAIYFEKSCPEWNIIDFAAMQIGVVTVAVHDNYLNEELKYVFDEIKPIACFVSKEIFGQKLQDFGFDNDIFCLEDSDKFPILNSLYQNLDPTDREVLKKVNASISGEDLATIVYTSGATGMPKGVMLSHNNIISNIKSCISLIPIHYKSVVASFLPLSHIFERTVNYTCIAVGASVWYIEDKSKLFDSIQFISPDFISCVPKVLEKNYAFIQHQLKQRPLLIRSIIKWALSSGKSYSGHFKWSPIYFLKKQMANLFLYRKWRKLLGGRLKYVGVGGAALDPELAKLYSCAGIRIRAGYGMTECSPVISFNRFEPGGVVFGSVGIPIPGVEVRIDEPDDDCVGEILVKGPNVMMGYFKNPELTKQVIKEGWFHTGDRGQFVNKRFLKISGRKKNMFKTTSGRYVVPERIENILNANLYIEHSYVIGDGKSFASALIVPDFNQLKEWAKEQNVHWTAEQFMVLNPKVEDLYTELIDRINSQLKSEEKIKKFKLIHDVWQAKSGELTSILKIKRKVLKERYHKEIQKMYA